MGPKRSAIRLRAVARSENPGGLVVLGGDNVIALVEIGLSDLFSPPVRPFGTSLFSGFPMMI